MIQKEICVGDKGSRLETGEPRAVVWPQAEIHLGDLGPVIFSALGGDYGKSVLKS